MARPKFVATQWRFEYHPARKRWETYRIPVDWPEDMFNWLIDTFGRPIHNEKWDLHGGWIYFYREECVSMFMLRWA